MTLYVVVNKRTYIYGTDAMQATAEYGAGKTRTEGTSMQVADRLTPDPYRMKT